MDRETGTFKRHPFHYKGKIILDKYAFDKLIQYILQTIANIKEGRNRTAEIIKGLLLYSRADTSELQKANIHESIDAALVLLKDKFKNYDLAIEKIVSYPEELSQVFTNFVETPRRHRQ